MKKTISTLLALTMTVSLVGCGGSSGSSSGNQTSAAAPTTQAQSQQETADSAPTEAAKAVEEASGSSEFPDVVPGCKVGVSLTDKSEQRWVMDSETMKAELEKRGFQVDIQFANLEPQTQIAQIENMIVTGCKAIVICPVDSGSMVEVLKKAKEAGCLVINYDLLILNTGDIDYYVGFDNKQVGKIQADFIVDQLGLKEGKGPFNIEVFAGSLDEVNAWWYHEEGMKVLQPYIDGGQLVVKSGQTDLEIVTIPGWSAETASARMENLVTTYYSDGTSLDAVLVPADGLAVAVTSALKGIGYGTADRPMPIITGNNANTAAIQSINDDGMSMTIFKDTRNLAKATADIIDMVANGETPVPNDTETFDTGVKVLPAFLYGMELVTKDNWRKVLLDSGYYTEEQLGIH